MKTLLKSLGYLVLGLLAVLALVIFGARFADGPTAIVAGGPFTSGEKVTGPEPDWSFAHDIQEVEFQLLDPPRSRTTWIVEHDGKVYIPSGYMTSFVGKIWKQWPAEAVEDGRAILRIDGKLYDRQLVRLQSGPALRPVLEELSRKYADGAEFPDDVVSSGSLWIFELAPRAEG